MYTCFAWKQVTKIGLPKETYHWKLLTWFWSCNSLGKINTNFKKNVSYLWDLELKNPYLVEHFLPSDLRQSNLETYTFYSRKFTEISEHIYFYREIVNSFEAMRKNPTRGWKVHLSSSKKKEIQIMMQKKNQ